MISKFSIFNDVIGPVMTGPSSSHTAGPVRIGFLAGQLVDGRVKKVDIEFDREGSFVATYDSQGSDRGFVGGLMGYKPDDPDLINALDTASQKGMTVNFIVTDFDAPHPNTAKLLMYNDTGELTTITGMSTGGGIIEIINIDGFDVSIKGDSYELLIFMDESQNQERIVDEIESIIGDYESISASKNNNMALVDFKLSHQTDAETIKKINSYPAVVKVKQIAPVYSVLARKSINTPFDNAEEMLKIAEEGNYSPAEMGLKYEAARSNFTEEQVLSEMMKIVDVMEGSIQAGFENKKNGQLMKMRSADYMKKSENNELIDTGAIGLVIARAMAIVEMNSINGLVVAAPTAGSCGTLPGAIMGVAEYLGSSKTEKAMALLAAGAVGIAIANQATFAAEMCGCQAECGSGSAMAAAGIIQLMGGTVKQANAAASLAMQNILGMICDPVGGVVEYPCLGRNVLCAVNAVSSANMILAGVEEIIPLDEVIVSMLEVGKMMPSELCCTGAGGLSVTKTSKALEQRIKKESCKR